MVMRADAEVLVIETDPQELRRLRATITRAGFATLAPSSPEAALTSLTSLRQRKPVLTLIDLDGWPDEVGGMPGQQALARLCAGTSGGISIACSAHTPDESMRTKHPHVLFQRKQEDSYALVQFIQRFLTARFGDLSISWGRVRHGPSSRTHLHRVAVSLLMARQANRGLYLDVTDGRAARRFNLWLEDMVRSSVRVVSRHPGQYELRRAHELDG